MCIFSLGGEILSFSRSLELSVILQKDNIGWKTLPETDQQGILKLLTSQQKARSGFIGCVLIKYRTRFRSDLRARDNH